MTDLGRRSAWTWTGALTGLLALGAAHCGGASDAGLGNTPDAGTDGTLGGDSGPVDDGGTPTQDGGDLDASDPDGGQDAAACGADFTACLNPSTGVNDFCLGSLCNACTDVTDDSNCDTAYSTLDGGPSLYICSGGACAPGNCHTTADCQTSKSICQSGTCTGCSVNTDCANDPAYGPGYVCNAAGECVAATCTTTSKACDGANGNPTFPGDFCCASAGVGGGNGCVAGNCCQDADCPSAALQCAGHQCVPKSCTLPGNSYWVDPHNGSDTQGSGSQGCPYKTIKQALLAMGAPTVATTITVIKNDPLGTQTGEDFPISVPANVLVKGQLGGAAAPHVYVPKGKSGFLLSKPNSGLQSLVIEGSGGTTTVNANSGLYGVAVVSGSSASTTTLQGVIVEYMGGHGIAVDNAPSQAGSGLKIGPGVQSLFNGTGGKPQSGLFVSGSAVVNVASTTDAISFSSNTQHGIMVASGGSVNVSGVPSATAGSGTVVANGNARSGLSISQTPGAAVPLNTVSGLVVFGVTNGNGIRITGGSNVTLSGSTSTACSMSGIILGTYGSGASAVNDLSKIDLGGGSHGSTGGNTFQMPIGANPNSGAGICMFIANNKGETLYAKNNKLTNTTKTAAVDCATAAAGTKVSTAGGCTGQVSVGGGGTKGNTVVLDNCSQ